MPLHMLGHNISPPPPYVFDIQRFPKRQRLLAARLLHLTLERLYLTNS
jgi:hypothetical protein